MGFWQGLQRMISGQPVYQEQDLRQTRRAGDDDEDLWEGRTITDKNTAQPTDDVAQDVKPQDDLEQPSDNLHTSTGEKIIPEVSAGECETHVSGDHREIWIKLSNDSPVDLLFEKMYFLGQTVRVDHYMRSGEEREFKVYSGPILKNGAYTKASLYYKIVQNTDYFQADFEVRYHCESDGEYEVTQLKLIPPIRDI